VGKLIVNNSLAGVHSKYTSMYPKPFLHTLLLVVVFHITLHAQNAKGKARSAIQTKTIQIKRLQSSSTAEQELRLITNNDSVKHLVRFTEKAIVEKKIILNIFINPVSNEILIHFKPEEHALASITWYNQNDKAIYSQTNLVGNVKNDIRLKIQAADLQLSKGAYKVLVRSKNKVYLKRLVFY
jgi:hypothetical protein